MAESERRKPPVTTVPQETFYTSQRREEYKSFGTEYLAPVLYAGAKSIEAERAAEEAKIRAAYTAQMASIEEETRAKFETDLAAKREEQRQLFEAGLTTEKDKSTFESDLATQEAEARATFEAQVASERARVKSEFQAQIAAQRGRLVEAPVRAAKREYAMTYGVQMIPRHYRAVKKSAEEQFKALAKGAEEAMEEQVKTFEMEEAAEFTGEVQAWKTEEIGKQKEALESWETEQRSKLEEDLSAWEKESKATFETQIAEWKKTEEAALEPQLEEWRKAWQPKGLAERMLEVKVPTLDIAGQLAKALGVKPISLTPAGMRIGDVIFTSKGVKPFKAEFAPLAFPAGVVASVESIVYGVGQLAGFKTPKIPATVTSGLITSGIESVVSGQLRASPELQALTEMPPEYGAGTIIGDIFVTLGISKGIGATSKAVKGAAGFVYEESGLKYSHALYEAKEAWLGIAEKLPKSPIAAIKQSETAYQLSEALSSLKHKIMPTKFMKVPAEGIIALPTVEEVALEMPSMAKEIVKPSAALETAKAIGLTPLEYGKAVYPEMFAGMELLGWAAAPKTAAFGLTLPKAIPKVVSPLAEALRETVGILPTAAEKWAVRAGVIPSPEEVIVRQPKDLAAKMIKGGRLLDIPRAADIFGFERFPYKEAATGKFFFEKEKLPTVKELLKAEKGEATLAELMHVPSKMVEATLPKLATLPEMARGVSSAQLLGAALTVGLKGRVKLEVKPLARVKPLAEEILEPLVELAPAERVKIKEAPAQVLETPQIFEQIFKPPTIQVFKPRPSIPLIPKKRREEALFMARRLTKKEKKLKKKMAGYLYPVLPERELPAYVKLGLGKAKKLKSATSFILGERKKNVLHKTRHKRK